MSGECGKHKQPLTFVCMAEECPDSSPICFDEQCIEAHRHGLQISLLPLNSTEFVEKRRNQNLERMSESKAAIGKYFELVRLDLKESIDARKKDCTVLDKIVLGVSNLKGGSVTAMDNLLSKNFSLLEKKGLDQLYEQLKISRLGEQGDKLDELQKELQRKQEQLLKEIKMTKESLGIRKVYRLDLFDRSKKQVYPRFSSSSSSWSFGTNKVDAIQFCSKDPMLLAGFVHMQLISCAEESLNLSIKVGIQGRNECEENKVIPKAAALAEDFQIILQTPVLIQASVPYDLSSENLGPSFQAKSGSGSMTKSGPFEFEKSKLDNNGTTSTSGQFKALICYDLL